jgi:hypothetical protein
MKRTAMTIMMQTIHLVEQIFLVLLRMCVFTPTGTVIANYICIAIIIIVAR